MDSWTNLNKEQKLENTILENEEQILEDDILNEDDEYNYSRRMEKEQDELRMKWASSEYEIVLAGWSLPSRIRRCLVLFCQPWI